MRRLETAEGWLCEDGEEDINDQPHDGNEREDHCLEDYGDGAEWPNDLESQEVLVSL